MGYNEIILSLLPSALGMIFPAILTYKKRVENSFIDLIRPLFDSDLRVLYFQKMLKELNSKEYYCLMICHENEVMDKKLYSMPSLFDSEYF